MVAKAPRTRRSSSSTNANGTTTKKRVPSASQEKKKVAKPIGICGFCLGDNEKNAQGIAEEMIHCAECGNSGHPSCLQYSDRLVQKIRTIHWQCIDCKRCIVCKKSDDSLLFCDFCDAGIHPKCSDPPLQSIPKGDFACHFCRAELSMEKTLMKSSSSSSSSSPSIRSRRSVNESQSNDESKSPPLTRPVAQLIDGMSNFFLPKKLKPSTNNSRQQSVQKAVKYLRGKKTSQRFKRIEKSSKENELLAKSILESSKTPRMIKKKVWDLNDEENPQTSTPLVPRPSNRKSFVLEPITPSPRHPRRSDEDSMKIQPNLSPISIGKKRSRNETPLKKKVTGKKRKESRTEEEFSSDHEEKFHLDLSKYKDLPVFINESLPETITEHDIDLFLQAKNSSTKLINECSEKFHHSTEEIAEDSTQSRWPPYIVLGDQLIKTWFSSSYPQEYARVPRLYICEFCLKYMKCEQVYDRHRKICTAFHPPANEIYHKDDLSVFEVDGNTNRIYCQNLCLLAKLFLDHKTLYYDVEPFLFYVLTRNDASGCHFLGYFSKEKHCPQKYNLSCITVLPTAQRRGYGRFLIELSYFISLKEGQVGTPERPLSTLGAQTYEAFWKVRLTELLLNYHQENRTKCTIKSIMNETGMASEDIIETLQNLGVLTMKSNEKPVITVDLTQFELMHRNEKIKHAHWVKVDEEYLRFTPVLTPHLLSNEEKAVEKEVKEIQIVFKEIGRDAVEAAQTETNEGTEGVRYVRRRKFGQKRRSIYVKRRVSAGNSKAAKNESMITHEDSLSQDPTINDDDDEHSQEYVPRRRISTIEENKDEKIPTPPSPPKNVTTKDPILKQSKLDRFLKVVRPDVEDSTKTPEKKPTNTENDRPTEIILTPRRRLNKLTQLQTENDPTTPMKTDSNVEDPLTRQISEGTLSTASSNETSAMPMDRPLPLKKRVWNGSTPTNLTRESSTTSTDVQLETPSSLAEILADPLLTSSSSAPADEEETLVPLPTESQPEPTSINTFETTLKPVEGVEDDQPPSLTSPTSMIVSQSNHYNYSTRNNKQHQTVTINNFNASTTMTYNYGNTSYPYAYPTAPPMDMPPYYFPPAPTMGYMPYYPAPSIYPTAPPIYNNTSPDPQSMFYSNPGANGGGSGHPMVYNGNGAPTYSYPAASTTHPHL